MFRDREDAAYQLAAALTGRDLHDPLVLAVPRGGVVTGAVLARELGAELDVVLSRKLRAPLQPELAVGAIAEDGRIFLNREAQQSATLTEDEIRRWCDDVVCLLSPETFWAIGQFYADFTQVEDRTAIDLLRAAPGRPARATEAKP